MCRDLVNLAVELKALADDSRLVKAAEAFSRAIIAQYRNGQLNDPFLREALQRALRQLDLRGFNEADRDPFFDAVAAAADPDHVAPKPSGPPPTGSKHG